MGRQLLTWRGQGERVETFDQGTSRIFFRRSHGGELRLFGPAGIPLGDNPSRTAATSHPEQHAFTASERMRK